MVAALISGSYDLHATDMSGGALIVLRYPDTVAGQDADVFHGERIADPYRWLETTTDPATVAWIAAQNELTRDVLSAVPGRDRARARLAEIADHPRLGVPFERGGRWFQFRNSGLQDQPVLYVMDAPDDAGRVLLDPNALADDGTVSVREATVSGDGTLLAYATSVGGSDWQTWRVRDVGTGDDLDDVIEWAKFSAAAWRADGSGFYYSAPGRPPAGTEYLAETGMLRILFHKIGSEAAEDQVLWADPAHPDWHPDVRVGEDGRFVIVSVYSGTAPQARLFVRDLADAASGGLRPLIDDFDSVAEVVTTEDSTFYLVTDYQAERKRLVAVDLDRPWRRHWRQVVGETADTLLGAYFFGGRFVCHYLRDAHSVLRVHAADGALISEIPVPGYMTVADGCKIGDGIAGRPGSDLVFFGLTSFAEPGSLWSHDLATGTTSPFGRSGGVLAPDDYVTEQVRVTSDDGTVLTMFLTRRADLEPSGDLPVLLYGYGGFDIAITPSFSVLHAAWLDRGAVLAVANLRGGGEYGRAWHDAGRLASKQNVFDDFCACARWLASSGWSRPDRIAIMGGSNGGLLVGACLTQHPELFGGCVASVGVLDMLRFHRFTVGRAWISDFGDPDDPEQFRWLRAYSPLHNLTPGRQYPATLLLTGDHDDRVVPGHSFKFAAALQSAQGGDAPVLIRVETSAGHGAGKPTSKIIAESADVLAFLERALGLTADTG